MARKHRILVVDDEADMAVGTRLVNFSKKAFKPGHLFVNRLFKFMINSRGLLIVF